MSDEGPPTKPRSPSAIRIQQWGLVELWLAQTDGRGIVLTSAQDGMRLVAIDPVKGERTEIVRPDEDPSRTALRAIDRMSEDA